MTKLSKKRIKAWVIKCSWNCLVIRAFEKREDAQEELIKIRKASKESGLDCTHKIIPCEIII